MEKAKITFWGGVETVTGANFIFEYGGKRLMVDCGLMQGGRFANDANWNSFPYDPASIDYLFVTHAHMDHIGRIPKLVKDGFKGTIFSTEETRLITDVMLHDGLRILSGEALADGRAPLYTEADINQALQKWQALEYHKEYVLGATHGSGAAAAPQNGTVVDGGIKITLKDAGHILGSAMIEVCVKNTRIVFTGDTGNSPTPLLPDTEEINNADYLILDSVYGDRNHEPLEERRARFREIIKQAVGRGGALIIPTFSVERSQVMLYEINAMVERGDIPRVPVFFDSPLASKITEIYRHHGARFKKEVKEELKHDDIFNFPELHFTTDPEDSANIHTTKNPKIIIAGSGMSVGGRVLGHERTYLPDPQSTILFVGYQVAGSLGRAVEDGAKTVKIDGAVIPVRAHIEHLNGYSSHKDSDHLVEFVEKTVGSLKKVFVVMGEPHASLHLVQRLRDTFDLAAEVPQVGRVYEIEVK